MTYIQYTQYIQQSWRENKEKTKKIVYQLHKLHPSETSVTLYQSSTATTASNRGMFIAELISVKLLLFHMSSKVRRYIKWRKDWDSFVVDCNALLQRAHIA